MHLTCKSPILARCKLLTWHFGRERTHSAAGEATSYALFSQVRLVFNAAPVQEKPAPRPSSPDDAVQLAEAESTLDQVPAQAEPEPAAVVAELLEDVAEEQKATIESICRHSPCFCKACTISEHKKLAKGMIPGPV